MTPPAASVAPSLHRGRATAPARPGIAPRRPRRVSGPSRRPTRRPLRQQPAQPESGLVLGLLAAAASVSRNPALDRLIRGRAWIVLIAFALIGIVTLQLLVLQLNASIGRALGREAQLQRENAALSIESSELAGGERVESQAAHMGMELVPPGALRFLAVDPRVDIARAAAALGAPPRASSASSASATGSSGEPSAGAGGSTPTAEAAPGAPGEAAASTATAQPTAPTAAVPAAGATSAPVSSSAAEASPLSASPSGASAAAPTEGAAAGAAGGTQSGGAG